MADTNTTVWTAFVEQAIDLAVRLYLTDKPMFRMFADVRPIKQAHPGSPVAFYIHDRLDPIDSELDEATDVTPVAMKAPRQVLVTPIERGMTVRRTKKLTELAFSGSVAADIGFQVAENLLLSLDDVYRKLLDTSTEVLWIDDAGGLTETDPVATRGTITSKGVAAAVALLRGRRAIRFEGNDFVAVVHPDVSFDLRLEVGDTAWQNPHQYVDTANIYSGEAGRLHGARFVENPRSTVTPDATNGDVYNSYFLGREAVVEAVEIEPGVVVGPVTDHLKRFESVGWYGLLGQSLFRQNCLQLVKTNSDLESISSAGSFVPNA